MRQFLLRRTDHSEFLYHSESASCRRAGLTSGFLVSCTAVLVHGDFIRFKMARLFEPFYLRKEEEETTRTWGLGLAFAKRITEQHGGKVEARRKPGRGTSFRMSLPVSTVVLSEVHS